ncbi:carboxymuconolactone decarboxylase family protein [Flavobacterium seoulense]|uniref:Carboxymuconolactone decarboxylase n=1 Tax=Flavobacterium seoulense TaxID=1492738 RepID=A0A066WP95_9FLAO|nr:carboxymuconolactone decarboxylase family protein [Flavobacterium seoulense]KDN55701.1 carboxymuconolactone decarboxylase [Flavobacterium seoulense]
MKIKAIINPILSAIILTITASVDAQNTEIQALDAKQRSIVKIASVTAVGDLRKLKKELNVGLNAGLTINQAKEVIVHLYAYCGFPRSIRGLQTLMEVIDDRNKKGISDPIGAEASPISDNKDKYKRGEAILEILTAAKQDGPKKGYAAFSPEIDVFLKEHLFADIFDRDVLTYSERELVTISVIAAIGRAEPMLQSHLNICLNVGLTPKQLEEFAEIIKTSVGIKEGEAVEKVLAELLKAKK